MVALSGASARRVSSAIRSRSSPVEGHGLPSSRSDMTAMPWPATRGVVRPGDGPTSQNVPLDFEDIALVGDRRGDVERAEAPFPRR